MRCRKFAGILGGYLYGEASEREKRGLSAHASACPACARLMAEMMDAVSRLESIAVPGFSSEEMAALRQRVKCQVASAENAPRPARGMILPSLVLRLHWPRVAAALATVALIIGVIALFRPSPRQEIPSEVEVVLSLAEDIEAESDAVGEICREIDDLKSLFRSATVLDSGAAAPAINDHRLAWTSSAGIIHKEV